MTELVDITKAVDIKETLLLVDAMSGQNAINVANEFNKTLKLTGLIMSKLDGDSRGGSALSIKKLTGVPIKFAGIGEKIEDLAHKLNYSMCGTWCIRRQIKAYIRLLGYKIIKEAILSDGKSRYECINNNGGKGWVSPAFTDIENGIEGYFVTWEP